MGPLEVFIILIGLLFVILSFSFKKLSYNIVSFTMYNIFLGGMFFYLGKTDFSYGVIINIVMFFLSWGFFILSLEIINVTRNNNGFILSFLGVVLNIFVFLVSYFSINKINLNSKKKNYFLDSDFPLENNVLFSISSVLILFFLCIILLEISGNKKDV